MPSCAYCSFLSENYKPYGLHLRIVHKKSLYGDILLCAQDGCPLTYSSFNSLKRHTCAAHIVNKENEEC